MIIGAGNIFFAERNRMNRKLRKANEEIEHLAKVAERERIARDLHDVLGHTLSVITLKSELAGKLIDRDPQRAGKEIREVEQISRQALVRRARRDSRIPLPGTGRRTGASQVHARNCRPDRAMRRRDHGETSRRAGECSLPGRARSSSRTLSATRRLAPAACASSSRTASAAWKFRTTAAATSNGEGNGLARHARTRRNARRHAAAQHRIGTTLTITLPLKEVARENEGSPD